MSDEEFERWYAAVATDERDHTEYQSPDRWYDISTGAQDRSEADERALRAWCRGLYERDGPVTTDVLERAFGERQRAIVERAIAACEHDFGVPFPFMFRIEVDSHWSNGISLRCIEPNGSAGGGNPLLGFDNAAAFAAAADAVQECTMETLSRAWPVCPSHDVGVHAIAHEAVPVWWCNLGRHVVAPIGELAIGS